MKNIKFIICGFGYVGRAFAELILDRADTFPEKYGFFPECTAVVDIGGAAVSGIGPLDLRLVLDHVENGGSIESVPGFGQAGLTVQDLPGEMGNLALIESTPTDIKSGEPGMTHILTALSRSWHVVTANKGPLVLNLPALLEKAEKFDCQIKFSGATAAALPTIDVGQTCLAGSNIMKIEGILNGTTNFVLTRMLQNNESYDDALRKTQEMGFAETDPKLDVEGWDTACKILLLANSLMNADMSLNDFNVTGITDVSYEDILRAMENGRAVKLVGSAEAAADGVKISVGPMEIERENPLFYVEGSEKGVVFTSDTMGRVIVSGGATSPVAAAAAMLKDLINIYKE